MVSERILRSFNLATDDRGKRGYVRLLEVRAAYDGGKIDDETQQAIRRGWFLSKDSSKNKLLRILESQSVRRRGGNSRAEVVD